MATVLTNHEEVDTADEKFGKEQFFNGLETLVVENILDTRETQECRHYLVCFKSWIAEEYLLDYQNLLENFWKSRITDNQDQHKSIKEINEDSANESDTTESIKSIDHTSLSTENVDVERTFDSEELLPPFPNNQVDPNTFDASREGPDSDSFGDNNDLNYHQDKNNKKRKLKTLDDIVRKIAKQNGGCHEDDEFVEPMNRVGNGVEENEINENHRQEMKASSMEEDDKLTKKTPLVNGQHIQSTTTTKSTASFPHKTQPSTPVVKSRQRYHKCRYCPTRYADLALLERHENSHLMYKVNRVLHAPPPLVPVSDEHTHCYDKSYHCKENNKINGGRDHLICNPPVRNEISRGYPSEKQYSPPTRDRHTQPISPNQTLAVKHQRQCIDIYCPLCKVKFGKVAHFQQHFRISHPNVLNFICKGCHIVFLSTEEFDLHECSLAVLQNFQVIPKVGNEETAAESHHNHQPSHSNGPTLENRCNLCGQYFTTQFSLNEHLDDHSDGSPPFCQICSKYFDRMDLLNLHIIEHRDGVESKQGGKSDSRLNCNGKSSLSCVPLSYHNERPHYANGSHHTSPRNVEQSSSRSSSTSYDSNEHQPYEPVRMVPAASKQFKENKNVTCYPYDQTTYSSVPTNQRRLSDEDSSMYYRHQQNQRAVSRPEQNHLLKVQIKSPIKPNAIKARPANFNNHHHHEVNVGGGISGVLECAKCGEKFTSPSLYDIHLQSHQELFECEKCHKSFNSRSQYDFHLQSHENNKSHKCPYCHRSFSMKGNLRRHIRIHTNEAPYECPICFQRFRRSDGLKGHIRRHETLGESVPTDLLPSQV